MTDGIADPATLVLYILGALGAYGFVRFFWRRQKEDDEKVNWTPIEAVGITIAIYFVSQIIAGILAGILGNAKGLDADGINDLFESSAVYQFIFVFIIEAITVLLLYWFMKLRRTAWAKIGLIRPKLSDIGYALTGFAIYFVIYVFFVFNIIERYFPQVDTEQAQELGFSQSVAGPELVFVFLSLVILPPLVEEILVRGFLYTGLRTKLPAITAALAASFVFAVAHLQWGSDKPLLWIAAADTFVLSLVLVWLRERTGSLWPGIGLHAIKNCIAFLALFIFKVT